MRAFSLDGFGSPPALSELPTPVPADGELLVRVQASSVNPVDNAIAAGLLNGMFEHEFPVVLGRDLAGVVEQAGPGAARFAAGDDVFGFVLHADPAVGRGTWAELITVAEARVARKPAGVELAAAGATPLAGIAALYAVDALGLEAGESVLVVGATGGVGSFAVQLASLADAEVIAPAFAEDEEYLLGLGVAEIVARDGDVAAAVRAIHPDGVDAVIDLVSYTPDAFEVYAAALEPDGRASSPLTGVQAAPGRFPVMAQPDARALERLAGLLDDGSLRVPIQRSYRLEEAAEALAALPATHTQGKLAISVA
jgi:NADPH:quinone reductase-like Zn-dependent oxidoreductase